MTQVSNNFTQLTDLDPVLTEIFFQSYDQLPDTAGAVFNRLTSDKAKETDLRIGSFADPTTHNGQVTYDEFAPDYEVEYVHEELSRGFIAERKLIDDMQYTGLFESASAMGVAFQRKRQKDAWSVFNNAFSSDHTGYDAKALVADDHPRSDSDSTSVDNNLALPLNQDNLETAITTLMALGDDRGEEISIMPNLLIVPRALRKTAHELVESPLTPEDANTAVNIHEAMQYLVVPWLTDTNAWFVVDTIMARRYLKWYDRIPVEFAGMEDFDTMNRRYRGYMRYSYGWSDFRWIVGSNPS